VLELRSERPTVVSCSADARAIDAIVASAGAEALRVAPDEALVVASGSTDAAALAGAVEAAATAIDPDALVVDATDGWSMWTLEGDATSDAIERLSDLDVVAGFAQGRVAVPAKVVIERSRLAILVPSMWHHAVHEFIVTACADLDVREAPPDAGTAGT
jgi:sarcosine oxidase gamma subunit